MFYTLTSCAAKWVTSYQHDTR